MLVANLIWALYVVSEVILGINTVALIGLGSIWLVRPSKRHVWGWVLGEYCYRTWPVVLAAIVMSVSAAPK